MQSRKRAKFLILFVALTVPMSVRSQTFIGTPWTQSSPAVNVGVDTNGTLIANAPLSSSPSSLTFNSTETGSNPQLLWVPGLSALRVGAFYFTPSTSTMGEYSAAFGNTAQASGEYSFATGDWVGATGMYSFASGASSTASGTGAIAMGNYSESVGTGSIAEGYETLAESSGSVALGYFAYSYGQGAVALGYAVSAEAPNSFATGYYQFATGNYSAVFGDNNTATSYASAVFGQFNTGATEQAGGTPSTTSWINTPGGADPLFEIADGTSNTNKSDALVVYKDGNAVLQGSLKVSPSGDIPMYAGN